jgi:RsiW-degrading membrane proteinase PrsW (M82 family)
MQAIWYPTLAILTVLAAALPAVAYSLAVWWLDRYEKEPWGLLAATFVWGAAPAIVLSLFAEFVMGIPLYGLLGEATTQLLSASLIAPVVEELVKGVAIVFLFLLFRQEFDGVLDGIVYGALVGFGFAMTENGLYFLGTLLEEGAATWLGVVFVRTVVFGLNHGLFGGIAGAGIGLAATTTSAWQRWLAPPLALGAAITVHGVHNLSANLAGDVCWPLVVGLINDWGGVIVLFLVVLLSWDRERGWIVGELRAEVKEGTLLRDEYLTVASYTRRVAAQWRALRVYGLGEARRVRKFQQVATELAFAKRRARRSDADRSAERAVLTLRNDLVVLRQQLGE